MSQQFIDFLYMGADERPAAMAEIMAMDEAAMQQLMAEFTALPADVQARLSSIQSGGEDPGPSDELLASLGAGEADSSNNDTKPRSNGNSPDAKWLAWIDENVEGGFVDWQPFDHPQLGPVEIGGFVPGVRVNPPAGHEDKLAGQQAKFAAAVLGMLPSLEMDEPSVEQVGGGVWRIGLTLRNTGTLPTKSAIGVKSRRTPGIVCVLDPGQALDTTQIVSGSRAIRFASIDGRGNSERAEWLVVAEPGDTVTLEVRTPLIGTTRYELTMEDNR